MKDIIGFVATTTIWLGIGLIFPVTWYVTVPVFGFFWLCFIAFGLLLMAHRSLQAVVRAVLSLRQE